VRLGPPCLLRGGFTNETRPRRGELERAPLARAAGWAERVVGAELVATGLAFSCSLGLPPVEAEWTGRTFLLARVAGAASLTGTLLWRLASADRAFRARCAACARATLAALRTALTALTAAAGVLVPTAGTVSGAGTVVPRAMANEPRSFADLSAAWLPEICPSSMSL
jgi:hypothetical protein